MKFCLNTHDKQQQFTQILKTLKSFTEEVNVYIDENRLYIQTMDEAHICLINIHLNKTWFDEYTFTDSDTETQEVTEGVCIGIQLKTILHILSCIMPNSSLEFSYGSDTQDDNHSDSVDLDNLHITIRTMDDNTTVKEKAFSVPIMNLDQDLLEVPDKEYEVELGLQSKIIQDVIHELNGFSDTINFHINENTIELKTAEVSDNPEMGSCAYNVTLGIEQIDEFSIVEDYDMSMKYSTKKLDTIMGLSRVSGNVMFRISEDSPLEVDFTMPDECELKVYLAPKMDDDE